MTDDKFFIDQNYKDLIVNAIDTQTGELTEENINSLIDKPLSIEVKENAVAEVFKLFDKDCDGLEFQMMELQKLMADRQRKREAVREIMIKIMKKHGVESVKTAFFEAKFKKNPPKIVIDDESKLDKYKKIEMITTLDKTAVKQDLQSGKIIDGAHIEQGERLEIK